MMYTYLITGWEEGNHRGAGSTEVEATGDSPGTDYTGHRYRFPLYQVIKEALPSV